MGPEQTESFDTLDTQDQDVAVIAHNAPLGGNLPFEPSHNVAGRIQIERILANSSTGLELFAAPTKEDSLRYSR